jgi:hypothetical protein
LQLSVLNACRQRVEAAPRWSTDTRAVGGEVALVTRARKAIRVLFPRDFAAFVWTDCRHDLIVLRGQNKHVVLFGRDGPAGDLLGDDLPADWLWPSQLRDRSDVKPGISRGRKLRAQKAKCGAADRGKDGGERQEL